jgi:starch phosphorylase
MKSFKAYQVHPNIPDNLSFLEELSRNMWWCWSKDAIELFRRIDPKKWAEAGRNPIYFFTRIRQERFEELAKDDGYLAHLDRVREEYRARVLQTAETGNLKIAAPDTIAYFSMEFGIHESLPFFAGGLGILAGDHLKAASNQGLPLTGVGLMYRYGYFRQYLTQDGWQQEAYPETDLYNLPVERARDGKGDVIQISVDGDQGPFKAVVWKVQIGRISLYLLDTNIIENPPAYRGITSRLYIADAKNRLAQEILLGIGGMRMLKALGLHPKVVHMNEGHCSFAVLEWIVQLMETHDLSLEKAMEVVPRSTIFTTHTPVAAGHDDFEADLVKPYLKSVAEKLGITVSELISWGQPTGGAPDTPLSMFFLGLRLAQFCNGVSELHGAVARRMWSKVWPDRPGEEVPISHVTNGIHINSFISQEFAHLFNRYLGPNWYMGSTRPENVRRIDDIYDEELWRAHALNRSRLVRTCREQLVKQYSRRNAPRQVIEAVENVMDQNILTVAFARRFATYKRASLLLRDTDRLEAIINHPETPVQFIFAGKAHPRDDEGKKLIQQLFEFANRTAVRDRFVFLEDYDVHLARHMVQGADVWLNTPRRPLEACGTSGMKAAVNGLINVSTLDGWWCEGYSEEVGWAIGNGEEYRDHNYQDDVESQALYNLLENEVIPCFYDRKNGDVPDCWVKKMKAAMKMSMGRFCSLRMISEYRDRFYTPAAENYDRLVGDSFKAAEHLAAQLSRLKALWHHIRVEAPARDRRGPYRVGENMMVTATVHLGELTPEEVDVELYYGAFKDFDALAAGHVAPMQVAEQLDKNRYRYSCSLGCDVSGRFGFSVRVVPRGDAWMKFTPGLISWAEE